MTASTTISKFLMILINTIFLIFGLAVVIIGALFKVGWDRVRHAFSDQSQEVDLDLQNAGDTVGYGAIILGAFILILSLTGCVGACCRVRCLLVLYAIVVIVLLIAEIIVVGVAVRFATANSSDIANGLRDSLKNYKEDSTDDRSKGFSALFSSLQCCGIQDYKTDFKTDDEGVPFYPSKGRDVNKYPLVIPVTCCKGVDYESKMAVDIFDKNSVCLTAPDEQNAYVKGCLNSIEDKIEESKSVLIGVGVTVFVIQILVIIMSFVLCCQNDYKDIRV